MTRYLRLLRNLFHHRDGSVAIEFAIVAVPLVMMMVGTIEVGRVLNIHNDLGRAADSAVRVLLIDSAASTGALTSAATSTFTAADDAALSLSVTDSTGYRLVQVTYPVSLNIPWVGGNSITLTVDRRAPL